MIYWNASCIHFSFSCYMLSNPRKLNCTGWRKMRIADIITLGTCVSLFTRTIRPMKFCWTRCRLIHFLEVTSEFYIIYMQHWYNSIRHSCNISKGKCCFKFWIDNIFQILSVIHFNFIIFDSENQQQCEIEYRTYNEI